LSEHPFQWVDEVPVGLIELTPELEVTYINREAERLLSFFSCSQAERGLANELQEQLEIALSRGEIEKGSAHRFLMAARNERYVRFSAQRQADDALVLTLEDVTELELAKAVEQARLEETDRAFTFSLLEPEIARKLMCTPEYYDVPVGPDRIKITGMIPDGGYRHVINILRILADLNVLGIFSFPGFEQDVLINTAIYHDIAKSQPVLEVGDVVDRKEVFPPGRIHAELSADMARTRYQMREDVCYIIRYHHRTEEELPSEFPLGLLPQFRLFRLIDGLSASITRHNTPVKVGFENGWIYVSEKNRNPKYAGNYAVNLYGGQRSEISEKDSRLIYQIRGSESEEAGGNGHICTGGG